MTEAVLFFVCVEIPFRTFLWDISSADASGKEESMSKENTKAETKKWREAYQNASGPVKISMTNDYLFKAFLQENQKALTGLISALLHLPSGKVRHIKIENPIVLGEHIAEKTVILDLNVTFNNGVRINIELQVVNEENWPERSVYYACRNYAKLFSGGMYEKVKPVYQIGIVDFTLFTEDPVFYATYQLRDEKNKHVYTEKFNIGVLDLTKINLATDEDKKYNIDKWAKLFKAKTWEEIRMIATKDKAIGEAAYTIYKISEDERIRQECEAREIFLQKEKAAKKKERKYKRTERELAKAKEQLAQKDDQLAQKDDQLAQKDEQLAKQRKEIEELRRRLNEQ